MIPVRIYHGGRERSLADLELPLELDSLVPGRSAWEVELGFGKAAYLLRRARERFETHGFLGIEIVSKYFRLARHRAARRGLHNVILARGEALYLICVALPSGFASAVHVYFPDPWPKSRHHKRRLFDVESIDLLLGMLTRNGKLYFATDHPEYGSLVREVLDSHGGVEVEALPGLWPEGPRTNYEAKYVAEGRPIVRLVVGRRDGDDELLHPVARATVLTARAGRAGR